MLKARQKFRKAQKKCIESDPTTSLPQDQELNLAEDESKSEVDSLPKKEQEEDGGPHGEVAKSNEDSEESGDDEDEGVTKFHKDFKLTVLYYKRLALTAIPESGVMRLRAKTLSFRSIKGLDFWWDLGDIEIEKFKGRINSGFIIRGKRIQCGSENDEYFFTLVKGRDTAFDRIHTAISEAKLDKEFKQASKLAEVFSNSHDQMESSSFRSNLSSEGDDKNVEQKMPDKFLAAFHYILFLFFKLFSALYKLCTGRDILRPGTLSEILHNLREKLSQILQLSKYVADKRTQIMIIKESSKINESLLTINVIARKENCIENKEGIHSDEGHVTHDDTSGMPRELPDVFCSAYRFLRRIVITIFRTLISPLYRRHLLNPLYPATINEAVEQTNEQLDELLRLSEKRLPVKSVDCIFEEVDTIRNLLANIKQLGKYGKKSKREKLKASLEIKGSK